MKIGIEAIKETQTEGILEMESLCKQIGNTDASIPNRIQEMEEIILGSKERGNGVISLRKCEI